MDHPASHMHGYNNKHGETSERKWRGKTWRGSHRDATESEWWSRGNGLAAAAPWAAAAAGDEGPTKTGKTGSSRRGSRRGGAGLVRRPTNVANQRRAPVDCKLAAATLGRGVEGTQGRQRRAGSDASGGGTSGARRLAMFPVAAGAFLCWHSRAREIIVRWGKDRGR